MWHFLYIVAFACLAFLAIGNLIRNLMMLGTDARRSPGPQPRMANSDPEPSGRRPVPHPELLDDDGNVIREPLLVMRSISVKDAREQLDALYDESGSGSSDDSDG
ncbi:DUF2973 domain-containing protein [filamentous cyanobacterium CCP5]|nr:DUF2973 domain-containing protein [filamentous cyanobacterium CCP5]